MAEGSTHYEGLGGQNICNKDPWTKRKQFLVTLKYWDTLFMGHKYGGRLV
jgi:hypothetical protein